jgi:hypothetical protein
MFLDLRVDKEIKLVPLAAPEKISADSGSGTGRGLIATCFRPGFQGCGTLSAENKNSQDQQQQP